MNNQANMGNNFTSTQMFNAQ